MLATASLTALVTGVGAMVVECDGSLTAGLVADIARLPLLLQVDSSAAGGDWLLVGNLPHARVFRDARGRDIVLANGLVRRTLHIAPGPVTGVATVALDDLASGESFVRAVGPEALVVVDGKTIAVGGLIGQPDGAFLLPKWIDELRPDPNALSLTGIDTGPIAARLEWKRVRHCEDRPWPPPGASLTLHFSAPSGSPSIAVDVHYDIYDGLPLIEKWITVRNTGAASVKLDSFTSERLAFVEAQSSVEKTPRWALPNVHVETDYAMHGVDGASSGMAVRWEPDPSFTTQVSYALETPCLLVCKPPLGPGVVLAPGASLDSFRTFELLHDSTDRERCGLAVRRMYRTIAPWVTENPILMHAQSAEPAAVKLAVDQCAEVGFEMAILSFGSGFDIENRDPTYVAQMKELAQYARSKNIELGGYSLLASRHVSDADDVIDPKTGKTGGAIFGSSPCLESTWGSAYFDTLWAFFEATGMSVLEHDGSYPGDVCASTSHPGHAGLDDSQWTQWKTIAGFYSACRARGIYLNVPDFYFLAGSTKEPMGYRETNWSLPRAQQILHARQNIFDGTWEKTPSMGWMFVPLTEYQGGGAAATIEPLDEHRADYEAHLAANFGAGVMACYRGPRLFDTDRTKALVKRWVDFFKAHRAILESDLLHLRRADGRDLDGIVHVNPRLAEKALAMLYNPLDAPVKKAVTIPLYYAGLTGAARVREKDGNPREVRLDRECRAHIEIDVPASRVTWLVFDDAGTLGR